ncbi:MAG: DUF1343 domain-containing protein [Longimicrobiales bacterium]
MVSLGVDRVLRDPRMLPAWALAGGRIGLLTSDGSPPGPASAPSSTRRALLDAGVPLARLFAPEHGLSARSPDGVAMAHGSDPETGLPVLSLYGDRLAPSRESLAGLDGVLVDLQDVGARFYTYLWTVSHLMESCALAGVPVGILDRPNPLGGRMEAVEGPLPDPGLEPDFLGRWPVPVRHSLTLGELALLLREEMELELELAVIPMEGWRRAMTWDGTGLPFRAPSPGLPRLQALLLYPGLALLEATNVTEGRGTPLSFQAMGAPWMDGDLLATRLNEMEIPGLRAEPVILDLPAPGNGPFPDTPGGTGTGPRSSPGTGVRSCPGARLEVTAPTVFRPVAAGLRVLALLRTLFPEDFSWRPYPTAANPSGAGHLLRLLRSRELVRRLGEAPETLLEEDDVRRSTGAPGWADRHRPHLLYS